MPAGSWLIPFKIPGVAVGLRVTSPHHLQHPPALLPSLPFNFMHRHGDGVGGGGGEGGRREKFQHHCNKTNHVRTCNNRD